MNDEILFQLIGLAVQLLIFLVPLGMALLIGSMIERRHLADLERRESELRQQVTATSLDRSIAELWTTRDPALVMGSVVISVDHFKRFIASLRLLVGGRVGGYESLMLRARREAMLRMQEQARALGRNAVINVRIESARIASGLSNGKGTTGIEVLAYGTAVVADVRAQRQLLAGEKVRPPWEQGAFTAPATARPPEPATR